MVRAHAKLSAGYSVGLHMVVLYGGGGANGSL
jgi:hypothetical protein